MSSSSPAINMKRIVIISLTLLFIALLMPTTAFAAEAGESLGLQLPVWSIIPFVGMLLSIALIPLFKPEWWEKNLLFVAIFWSLVFLIPFAIGFGPKEAGYELIEIIALDYLPFIVLLWGLFAVAGGIALRGSLAGSPKVNIILLLIGTFLASWIGTTGASMLLIRPVLKANKWRKRKTHVVVFFIFLVSNMGGCLTPVGDPPLFLGFLRGVPFFWTMKLAPILIFNVVILLVVFLIIDQRLYKRELAAGNKPEVSTPNEKLSIAGGHNLIFIAMIVGAVILSGSLDKFSFFFYQATGEAHGIPLFPGIVLPFNSILQMLIIIAAGVLSVVTTKKDYRALNEFTWGPIKEVGFLFVGIFITMIPALAILHARGADLGLESPWQFFWATGALSSFLDNAPTYLVFMTTAGSLGEAGLATAVGSIAPQMLMAISAGAVFMGANTYIGNAPNFMVRSIAEENHVKMPSFFGYMLWSLCILIPVFIIDTFVFFI